MLELESIVATAYRPQSASVLISYILIIVIGYTLINVLFTEATRDCQFAVIFGVMLRLSFSILCYVVIPIRASLLLLVQFIYLSTACAFYIISIYSCFACILFISAVLVTWTVDTVGLPSCLFCF